MKRLGLALVCLAIALSAAAAPEKWFDAYNRGVTAVNGRNYAGAAEALQKAIAEMPKESIDARAGNKIITYVPHFWLGIAKFNLGDVDGALREWKISEDQGAIQNTMYFAQMKDWISRAQAEKGSRARDAAAGARNAASNALNAATVAQSGAVAAQGTRTEQYRNAQAKMAEAAAQFKAAGTDQNAFQKAAATATQARDLFNAAAEEGKRLKAILRATPKPAPPVQQPQPAPAPVNVVVEQPKPVPPPQPVPQPAPAPKVEEQAVEREALVSARVALQQYRRKLTEANSNAQLRTYAQRALAETKRFEQELAKDPGDKALERISGKVAAGERELSAKMTQLASIVPEVPDVNDVRAQLQTAYRAFAVGDLDASEQQLSALLGKQVTAEAYLLRGCARFTRATLTEDDVLLRAAEEDFRAALKLNRGLRLSDKSFSPKLVAFFEGVRKR